MCFCTQERILDALFNLLIPWMIRKVDNLKWIRSTIKREVKEKLTEGISPKKKVGPEKRRVKKDK